MSIGVIILNWNYGCFLKDAIESVLNQTRKANQIVIVDDASRDNSWEVLRQYKIKPIIHSQRIGTVKSLNEAMEQINTDLVLRLDADDMLKPDALKKLVRAMEHNPDTGFIYFQAEMVGSVNGITNYPIFKEGVKTWHKKNFVNGSAIFRREIWETIKFREHQQEDYLFFRTAYKKGWKGGLLNEILMTIRYHWEMGHRHNNTDLTTRTKWLRQKRFIQ